jgi:hypothetical protein
LPAPRALAQWQEISRAATLELDAATRAELDAASAWAA